MIDVTQLSKMKVLIIKSYAHMFIFYVIINRITVYCILYSTVHKNLVEVAKVELDDRQLAPVSQLTIIIGPQQLTTIIITVAPIDRSYSETMKVHNSSPPPPPPSQLHL